MTVRARRAGDAFVVVASDGLWDLLSSQDAVDVVAAHADARGRGHDRVRAREHAPCEIRSPGGARHGHAGGDGYAGGSAGGSAAQALVDEAMRRAAAEWGLQVAALKGLPAGRTRRQFHDDISVVVYFLR